MSTGARTASRIALRSPVPSRVPGRDLRFPPTALDRRPRPLPGRATASRRAHGRTARWLREHTLSVSLVAALLVVIGVVLGTGAADYPSFSDDEGTYVAQAWAVTTQNALSHYTYWYDHPPLGWLQLSFASWLLGPLVTASDA